MAKSFLTRTSPWLLLALTVAACQAPLTGLSTGTGRSGGPTATSVAQQARQTGSLRVAIRWPERRIQDIAYRTQAIELMVWEVDQAGNRKPALQRAGNLAPVAIATDSGPVAVDRPVNEPGTASASEPLPEFVPVEPIVMYKDGPGVGSFPGLLGGEDYLVTAVARDASGQEIGHAEARCDIIPGSGNWVSLDMKAANPPLIDGIGDWAQQPLGPGATFSVLLKGHEKDLPLEADLDVSYPSYDSGPYPMPSGGESSIPGGGVNRISNHDSSYPYGGNIVRLDHRVVSESASGSLLLEISLPDGLPGSMLRPGFGRIPVFNVVVRVDNVRSNAIPVNLDLSKFPERYPNPYPSGMPTSYPSWDPSYPPTDDPSWNPSPPPTDFPSWDPSFIPSEPPKDGPSDFPSDQPPIDPSLQPTPGSTDDPVAVIDNLEPIPDGVSVYDVGRLMCNATGSFMTEDALMPWGIFSIRTPPNPSYGPRGQNLTEGHVPAFFGRDFGDLCAIGTTPAGQLPGPGTGYGAAHIQLQFAQPKAAVGIDFIGGPRPYRLKAFDASGSLLVEDTLVIPEGANPRQLHRLMVEAATVPIQRVVIGCDSNAGVLIRRIAYLGLPD